MSFLSADFGLRSILVKALLPKLSLVINRFMVWPGSRFIMNTVFTGKGIHDDVIKWKHLPRYWPFVRGIHRSPVNSPHKGRWRGASMLSLICAWTNGWVNNRDACDLRRHRDHYDVTVMFHGNPCTGKTVSLHYIVPGMREVKMNK